MSESSYYINTQWISYCQAPNIYFITPKRWVTYHHLDPNIKPRVRVRRGFKLTMVKVDEIRALLQLGILHREIAERYKVSMSTISLIRTGKLWRD